MFVSNIKIMYNKINKYRKAILVYFIGGGKSNETIHCRRICR